MNVLDNFKPLPGSLLSISVSPEAHAAIYELMLGANAWQLSKIKRWQRPQWN